jgi:hypothetical protein
MEAGSEATDPESDWNSAVTSEMSPKDLCAGGRAPGKSDYESRTSGTAAIDIGNELTCVAFRSPGRRRHMRGDVTRL